jgi:ferric-dicitrate binding protein FerR (iron transport regulator)
MKGVFAAELALLVCALASIDIATAQPADTGCSSENSPATTQTLRCSAGITIVAENGARYTLRGDGKGHVEAVELDGKALLIEVPAKSRESKFRVITPQAIAAVRGTKWAVDVSPDKVSVFVVDGLVNVARRTGGRSVSLRPGEGVDVEPGVALTVKRWAAARVSALLARLGQQAR